MLSDFFQPWFLELCLNCHSDLCMGDLCMYLYSRVCLCLSFKSYEPRFCCFFNIPMFVYFCILARDGEFQQCTVAVHIFVYIFFSTLSNIFIHKWKLLDEMDGFFFASPLLNFMLAHTSLF